MYMKYYPNERGFVRTRKIQGTDSNRVPRYRWVLTHVVDVKPLTQKSEGIRGRGRGRS